jgi:nucleoside-diphosphate-sugar epimerase
MPFSMIHAHDLARGMRIALEANVETGRIFYLTDGRDYTLFDLTEAMELALGLRARWITIPEFAAAGIAELMEFIASLQGEIAGLGRQKVVELMQTGWRCDSEPLRRVTGFRPEFNLTSGMEQTVAWYRKEGWI